MSEAIYDNKKSDEVILDGSEVGESDYNSRANSNIKSNRYTEVDNNILLNPIEGYDQNFENNNPENNNQNTNNNIPKTKSFRKPMIEKYKFKIILLGEKGVGKSSLIGRYINNSINLENLENNEIFNKKVDLDEGTRANISIYDTNLQEKLQKFSKDYYRDAHGALIIFDLFDEKTFEKIDFWINELKSNAPKDIVYAIIGNKSDKIDGERVKFENAISVAGDNLYYEVSAKSGNNVSLAFEQLVYGIIEKQNEESKNPDKVLRGKDGRKSVDLKEYRKSKTKKGCCI